VAHSIVSYVVNDLEVMNSMEGHSAIVSLVNSVVASVGLVDGTNHMEMNGVATQLESLSDVSELNVLNSADNGLISGRVEHDVSTEHILVGCFRVSSVDNISG
jgi:hypothetical protein